MKVLVVSNMYPGRNPDFEYAGIFVKEQCDSLNKIKEIDCELDGIDGFKAKYHYLVGSFAVLFKVLFGNYDVVRAHYGLSALFTLLIPFKKWKNVVLTLHGGDILSDQGKSIQVFLTKRIVKKVGHVITLNEAMNLVVSKLRKDYIVLPCGVDDKLFMPNKIDLRKNVVLFPGRKSRVVKNYSLFEKIIKAYNDKYEKLTPIILDGFDRHEVKDLMCSSSVILMTSISEGSPQAIKEAMCCDMAILSSNVGDVSDVIGSTPGTGVFDLNSSPEKIASRLNDIIKDARKTEGARRRRIIDLQLTNDSITSKLINIYKEVS